MKSRVCITVENSHQPPRVFISCYANIGKHQYLLLRQDSNQRHINVPACAAYAYVVSENQPKRTVK